MLIVKQGHMVAQKRETIIKERQEPRNLGDERRVRLLFHCYLHPPLLGTCTLNGTLGEGEANLACCNGRKTHTLLQSEFVHTLPHFRAVCLMVLPVFLTAQQLLQSIQSTITNLVLQSQKWLKWKRGLVTISPLVSFPGHRVGVTWVLD